ncbi:acyltransferase domain-containing protein [Streptomyces sp. MS1.HAVA.3]|uniref:Acyltransferase domain-containing protein n=1 Tax=Streptomyces caledonius TaxID=3134107 RepID=A0ABU8UC67_9ACTN
MLPRLGQGPHRTLPVRGGHRGTDQDGPGRPPPHDRAAAADHPHPDLRISAAGLRFADTARPWPSEGAPRRAAVSSFGFGGTNVHVVLEEQPVTALGRLPVRAEGTASSEGTADTAAAEPQLLLLSAGNPELLDEYIEDLLDTLDRAPGAPIAALAHTLGAREPLTTRLAIVAADTEEFTRRLRHARRQLTDGARGDLGDGAFAADAPLPEAQRRIAFVFPGQGSQRPGMLQDLHERFTGFRTDVNVLSAVARRDTGFDLADLLYGEAAGAGTPGAEGAEGASEELGRRLTATDVCQPLLGTVQIAATRLLAHCGVAPDLALGHSVGEFAAAAAAGALTAEDTVRLLVHRGAALRQAETALGGGMLVVQTDKDTCGRLIAGVDDVWLACFNQPRQVVVSGTPHGLAAVREACAEAGIVTVALDVSDAFHSPRLACAEETIRTHLAGRRISGPVVPFVSSVNAAVCADPELLRELWARHASTPVHFDDAVRTAYDQGARIFLQVTGGSSLLSSVRRNLTGHGQGDVHLVPAGGEAPDGGQGFVRALARLAVLGVPVDPRALVPREDRRLLDLPVAKLDTQSYWVPGGRPAKKDESTASLPPRPAPHEETPMAPMAPMTSTDGPTSDPTDRVLQLVRLVQEQVALLIRLAEAQSARAPAAQGHAAQAPAAEATEPATAGPVPEPVSPPSPPPPTRSLRRPGAPTRSPRPCSRTSRGSVRSRWVICGATSG